MIIFDNRQEVEEYNSEIEDIIQNVINKSLEHEGFNYEYEISVSLVDNTSIREINREHREIDRATDVLSFPMIEYDGGYYSEDFKFSPFDITPDGYIPLGDIVLSLERAREQSIEYGHSYYREVAFLTCHSVLHLLGHDHMEEAERVVMRQKEESILSSLSFNR
ncbi:MAG: rRNA maturation RNase YbeY [Clostridium sp.]